MLAACSDQTFQGQAFLADKSGAATRLSDMEIHVVEEQSFLSAQKEYRENIDRIIGSIASRENSVTRIELQMKELKQIEAVLLNNEDKIKPVDPTILSSVTVSLNEISDIISITRQLLNSAQVDLENGSDPEVYFLKAYPGEVYNTRTDVDGKFSFKLDKPQSAIIATRKDKVYWYVRLSKNATSINITNSNEFKTSCVDCVIMSPEASRLKVSLSAYAKEQASNIKGRGQVATLAANADDLLIRARQLNQEFDRIVRALAKVPTELSHLEILKMAGGVTAGFVAEVRNREIDLKIKLLAARDKHTSLCKEFASRANVIKAILTS